MQNIMEIKIKFVTHFFFFCSFEICFWCNEFTMMMMIRMWQKKTELKNCNSITCTDN